MPQIKAIFRRCALARNELEYLEESAGEASNRLKGELAIIGSQRGGYKLSPEALTPAVSRAMKDFFNLKMQLYYARQRVPVYSRSREEGLERRLQPRREVTPIITINCHDHPRFQSGVIHKYDREGKPAVDYIIWEGPRTSGKSAHAFSGPCVRVQDGYLFIASEEHDAIFMVSPLTPEGIVNPNIDLAIEYRANDNL